MGFFNTSEVGAIQSSVRDFIQPDINGLFTCGLKDVHFGHIGS
jgi:hypothetical protein